MERVSNLNLSVQEHRFKTKLKPMVKDILVASAIILVLLAVAMLVVPTA